jgi:uncharacterized protein YoxC
MADQHNKDEWDYSDTQYTNILNALEKLCGCVEQMTTQHQSILNKIDILEQGISNKDKYINQLEKRINKSNNLFVADINKSHNKLSDEINKNHNQLNTEINSKITKQYQLIHDKIDILGNNQVHLPNNNIPPYLFNPITSTILSKNKPYNNNNIPRLANMNWRMNNIPVSTNSDDRYKEMTMLDELKDIFGFSTYKDKL